MTEVATIEKPRGTSLVMRFADRYGLEPARVLDTLKATAFKTDKAISNEQMMALMIVAERYSLDPFTKELYAYPDKGGGIVPVVSVDGWARIVNEHPMMDGFSFEYDKEERAMTCTIWRKDRSHPTPVTEYIDECKRDTPPWNKSPRRMIRHRSFMQCARLAFGFAGIYDEDEAQRIIEMGSATRVESPSTGAQRVRAILSPNPSPELVTPVQPVEDAQPPAMTYDELCNGVLHAPDAESAAMLVDAARSMPNVTAQQLEELARGWAGKWQPNEESE